MKHSIGLNLTHGIANTVMTVPAGYKAEVSSVFVSNKLGNNKSVTIYWQHAHDSNHKIYIVTDAVIVANNYLSFQDKGLVMQAGDILVMTPEASSDMSTIVSFDLRKEQAILAFDGE
tara:strand:+ start:52 stop:402 length:351 start_codon:yes stop_codon:yes gene_type:complete